MLRRRAFSVRRLSDWGDKERCVSKQVSPLTRWAAAGLLVAALLVLVPGAGRVDDVLPVEAQGSTPAGEQPTVRTYPAHYVVLERGPGGDVRPLAHRLVQLSAPLQSLDDGALAAQMQQTERDVLRYAVRLESDSGQTLYQNVVEAPRWVRAEFHGAEGPGAPIDGQILPLEHAVFVVRVPASPVAPANGAASATPAVLSLQESVSAQVARFELEQLAMQSPEIHLDEVGQSAILADNGPPGNRVDLLVVGDGYTSAQQGQFELNAQETVDEFLGISPYADYRNYVNVRTLFVPSAESGADHPSFRPTCNDASCCGDSAMLSDPLQGTMVDTAFDARYCAHNIHRLLVVNTSKVAIAAAAVPDWDQILVIVNDTTYGGSGGAFSVISMHSRAPEIAQHEYGHTFAGLADEYETAYPGYPGCSDLGGPACEPNVTDVTARVSIKWSPWILPSVPIPTEPEFDPAFVDVVGLFEGARYKATGMYRPGQNCIMRALGRPYCAVPSQAYVLTLYNGGWGTPAEGIRPVEPGSLSPATATIALPVASSQTFGATILQPVGGPEAEVRWTVDGVTEQTQAQVFTYTPRPSDAGRSVEIGLHVGDRTPLVHPAMAGEALTFSHTWTVAVGGVPLTGVTISGPTTSQTGQTDVFTAQVEPQAGVEPVTYSWSPEPGSGQGTSHATYTWHTPGAYTLSVQATNVAGAVVSDTHTVQVELGEWTLYLPVTLRSAARPLYLPAILQSARP